jgi:hypothetical protein
MSAQIIFGAEDFFRLSKQFERLPEKIKTSVTAKAMRRVAQMGATQVVKRAAERINIPQKFVRERTSAFQRQNEGVIYVRSDWIELYKLGARQTRTGVTVRARGSYQSAFIAKMKSGHVGVFMREGSARLPIQQLHGPNPANDINTSPDIYTDLMVQVAEHHVMPRLLHELGRALPR